MLIEEFIRRAGGRVRINLSDGSIHTGHFRTDTLSPSALAAYFVGDARDMSLPIGQIDSIESI